MNAQHHSATVRLCLWPRAFTHAFLPEVLVGDPNDHGTACLAMHIVNTELLAFVLLRTGMLDVVCVLQMICSVRGQAISGHTFHTLVSKHQVSFAC